MQIISTNNLFRGLCMSMKSGTLLAPTRESKEAKSSSLGLVVIDSISMPICNRFHTRLADNDNDKITIFKGYVFKVLANI